MNAASFASYALRRDRERREHVPEVEKIIPLIHSSPKGRTRAEITKGVDLKRDTLSAVLDAFVQSGLLIMRREGGILVYQARPGAG
jgi:hypothetical protein